MVDADKFHTRTRGKRTLYTTILKLGWADLKTKWKDAYNDIWKTGTMFWEFEKPDPNAPPPSLWQRVRNFYPTNLVFNTLHPGAIYRPAQLQERSVRTSNASLNLKVPAKAVSALEYPDAPLDMFNKLLNALREGSDWAKESQNVHMTPGKHGISQTDVIFVYSDDWDAVFDLAKGAFVEGYTLDDACPKTLLSSVSLRKLTVSLEQNVAVDEDFLRTLTSHPMQELNIAYRGHNVLFYTDHIVKAWHEFASSFCLTLINRTDTTHGQVVLQVALDRGDISFPVNSASSVHGPSTTPSNQQQALPALQFMHWDCDHIFAQLSDYSASFLHMATLQHPITLTQFTLDISQLSRASLASAQNILHRSLLEHLHVVCTPIADPSLWAPIAQVLNAVQWLILKSLALSGDNINGWASLWPSSLAVDRQLLTLHIQATGSHLPVQALHLSHASVLLLHHLIFTSPQLLELQLVNVHLQDQHDWTVLVNSLDFLQTSLRLDSGSSITQLLSVKPAAKLFLSQMETVCAGTERREQLVLHEFTLEIAALSEQVLERIQRFIHMYTIKTLHVQCPLFDADKAQTFAQALGDLPWSAFQSVVLEGENVNGWLELLAKVDGLRLKCLKLVGTAELAQQQQQQQQQVLSESSVLFIGQLVQAGTVVDHESVGMSSAGAR
ncbi:hypothetical protein CPB97_002764 [Podila verticillata]|nr:hypothetical protein CPB97_002764 [Podila verticillata]